MNEKLFPLVFSTDLAATKRFYGETLGCELVHDLPHYLQVRFGKAGPELCFMLPKAVLGAEGEPFAGKGLVLRIRVEDVDGTHTRYASAKAPIVDPPSDRPWGWRS